MEDLLLEQKANFHSLARFMENFKKLGKANITEAGVRSRLALLATYWERCRAAHLGIEKLASAEDRTRVEYFTAAQFGTAEEQYLAMSDYLHEYLARFVGSAGAAAAPAAGEYANSLKLPLIELPKFSGNYTEWQSFRDLFESIVVDNRTLSQVQRLHYLKASLTGEAGALLKNLAVTEQNYASASETLKTRYENRRVIITSHVHSIVALSNMTTESSNFSAPKLRKQLFKHEISSYSCWRAADFTCASGQPAILTFFRESYQLIVSLGPSTPWRRTTT